jgi:UDP-glucuronate decarboxylase
MNKAKEVLGWEAKIIVRDELVLMEDDLERLFVPKKTKA